MNNQKRRKKGDALVSAVVSADASAADVVEAPTFDNARMELYRWFNGWVFARVCRPCTVPADARKIINGVETITYFHGIATTLTGGSQRSERVWFKKPPTFSTPAPLKLGPIKMHESNDGNGDEDEEAKVEADVFAPSPGDILMGKLDERDSDGKKLVKFGVWYPHAAPLWSLYNMVCNGTAKSELELHYDLKNTASTAGKDDIWALARLVLFGNVRAFADDYLSKKTPTGRMKLSCQPHEFVFRCSLFFEDASMWEAFKHLVPDVPQPVEKQKRVVKVKPIEPHHKAFAAHKAPPLPPASNPSSSYTFNPSFVPNSTLTSASTVSYDDPRYHHANVPLEPQSPVYIPRTPPLYDEEEEVTPLSPCFNPGYGLGYNPTTPPFAPASPAYSPTTPPLAPASPAYSPTTPPLAPASPAYSPTTPPLAPASPAYSPTPFQLQPFQPFPPLPLSPPPPPPPPPPFVEPYDPDNPGYGQVNAEKVVNASQLLSILKNIALIQAQSVPSL